MAPKTKAAPKKTVAKTAAKAKPKAKAAAKPAAGKPDFYLMKSEPLSRLENGVDVKFSIDDLAVHKMEVPGPHQGKVGIAEWDGVRNYQARNVMRSMKVGDKAFFYHSNAKPSGIVGVAEIVREAYPDPHQFDPKDAHYAPDSSKDNPTWDCVDVKFVRKL